MYLSIDRLALRVQTHCTPAAACGMMRMCAATGELACLAGAQEIGELYVRQGGMMLTYQNLNWWGRSDAWIERCAIVDSFMLFLQLYQAIGEEDYRVLAARVWHNGFVALQHADGGAGTDTIVSPGSPRVYLASSMYEACFCCAMRLAEGCAVCRGACRSALGRNLRQACAQRAGVYMDGDIVWAEATGGGEHMPGRFPG